jgi:hypothetical protein
VTFREAGTTGGDAAMELFKLLHELARSVRILSDYECYPGDLLRD